MKTQSRNTRSTNHSANAAAGSQKGKNQRARNKGKPTGPSGSNLLTPKVELGSKTSQQHPQSGKEEMKTQKQIAVIKAPDSAVTKPVTTPKLSPDIAALHAQLDPQNVKEAVERIMTSMRTMGQMEPIRMLGDTVIDGVKRLAACKELGIEPKVIQVSKDDDPVAVWASLNMCREHMTSNELALLAIKICEMRGSLPSLKKDDNGKPKPVTQQSICDALHVSTDTVSRIRKAMAIAEELGLDVDEAVTDRLLKDGSPSNIFSTLETQQVAKRDAEKYGVSNQKLAHELHQWGQDGRKFSFLYADPPWAEAVRKAPYPVMPTWTAAERLGETLEGDGRNANGTYPSVYAMGKDVKAVAAKNCVLWLWTTSSLLPNGLAVMKEWGFTFVTSIVWAKSHTVSTKGTVLPKHEWLLIGRMEQDGAEIGEDQDIILVGKKGRGLSTPSTYEQQKDGKWKKEGLHIASVVEVPETQQLDPEMDIEVNGKVAHSRKPEEFARLAEMLYPHAVKLELFARQPREGWATWGNQSDGEAVKELTKAARQEGHHEAKEAKRGAETLNQSGKARPRKGKGVRS